MTDPLVLMSAVRGEHSHVGGMFRGLGVRNLPSVISPRRADVSAALTARRSRARLCSQDLLIALVAQESPERVHSSAQCMCQAFGIVGDAAASAS
jgi:hypothetical protein